MRLTFKTIKPLQRASKRLAHCLADSVPSDVEFHFKNATAYVAGYSDWPEFTSVGVNANFSDAELSQLDEECDVETLARRREYQAARLSLFCQRYGIALGQASLDVVEVWRPSAGRPQEDTQAFTERERLLAEGEDVRCRRLLRDLEVNNQIPSEAEVGAIIRGLRLLRGFAAEFTMTYVGPLATRLVNRRVNPAAHYGVRLLEALVANGFSYPVVSLAKALRNGWGAEENHPRALSLVNKALRDDVARDGGFSEPSAYIELYRLGAFLLLRGTNCPRDPARALALYRKAAELGDGPSALATAQFYMPLPAGQPTDEYCGVVPPDIYIASSWFQRALDAGYDPETKSFPEGALS